MDQLQQGGDVSNAADSIQNILNSFFRNTGSSANPELKGLARIKRVWARSPRTLWEPTEEWGGKEYVLSRLVHSSIFAPELTRNSLEVIQWFMVEFEVGVMTKFNAIFSELVLEGKECRRVDDHQYYSSKFFCDIDVVLYEFPENVSENSFEVFKVMSATRLPLKTQFFIDGFSLLGRIISFGKWKALDWVLQINGFDQLDPCKPPAKKNEVLQNLLALCFVLLSLRKESVMIVMIDGILRYRAGDVLPLRLSLYRSNSLVRTGIRVLKTKSPSLYEKFKRMQREAVALRVRAVAQCSYCNTTEDDEKRRFKKCGVCKKTYFCSHKCAVSAWECIKKTDSVYDGPLMCICGADSLERIFEKNWASCYQRWVKARDSLNDSMGLTYSETTLVNLAVIHRYSLIMTDRPTMEF